MSDGIPFKILFTIIAFRADKRTINTFVQHMALGLRPQTPAEAPPLGGGYKI